MKRHNVKLLEGARIFAPSDIGVQDILIVNDRIVRIGKNIKFQCTGIDVEHMNLRGKYVIPGIIDQHVHITGGGGESGFSSRIGPVETAVLLKGGVTTVVGLLGTDGTSRTISDLYGCAGRIEKEGVSSYILTGSYEYPPVTLTGSLRKDIMFVDKIIGVKTAISDHRASCLSCRDLANLASSARVAGMLCGKAGTVTIHVGDGQEGLDLLFEVLEKTNIPIRHFLPTHLNRNKKLLEASVAFGKAGGYLDFTSVPLRQKSHGDIPAGTALEYALKNGVPETLLTMSSDGNGSWSRYNSRGQVTKIGVSNPQDLFYELQDILRRGKIPAETVIRSVTENPARALCLHPVKGSISEGSDADIVILGRDYDVESVIARGACLFRA